jgi:hypothetical protein
MLGGRGRGNGISSAAAKLFATSHDAREINRKRFTRRDSGIIAVLSRQPMLIVSNLWYANNNGNSADACG